MWFSIIKNRGFDNRLVEHFKKIRSKESISLKILTSSNLLSYSEWIDLVGTYGVEAITRMIGREAFIDINKRIRRGDKSRATYKHLVVDVTLLECYIEQNRFYVRYELKQNKKPEDFSTIGASKAVIEISFDHNIDYEKLIKLSNAELRRYVGKTRPVLRGLKMERGIKDRLNSSMKVKSGESFITYLAKGRVYHGMSNALEVIFAGTFRGYYDSIIKIVSETQVSRDTDYVLRRIREREGGTPSSDALREED
tara:strand:+ start:271 stop:1029 length:759 start_codon:yes stop_codon:yes gene_type:complete